jgi:hypothetical protein
MKTGRSHHRSCKNGSWWYVDGSRHVPGGEWAGGLASLANCHKKIDFPLQNNELPGKIRESLEKKKETQ